MALVQAAMNPLLKKAISNIEKKVPPKMNAAYQRIVTAGLKAAFDKKTHGTIMDSLPQSQDPVGDVAKGSVGLMLMLHQASKGTMPVEPMIFAGMTLTLEGLDYIEKTMKMPIGKSEIDRATELYLETISPKVGVTPDVMTKVASQAQTAINNPKFNAQFKGMNNGPAQ